MANKLEAFSGYDAANDPCIFIHEVSGQDEHVMYATEELYRGIIDELNSRPGWTEEADPLPNNTREEALPWLNNALRYGGSFVCAFARAVVASDAENFTILMPALKAMMVKYPKYDAMRSGE